MEAYGIVPDELHISITGFDMGSTGLILVQSVLDLTIFADVLRIQIDRVMFPCFLMEYASCKLFL
jgi:hypothetical protein